MHSILCDEDLEGGVVRTLRGQALRPMAAWGELPIQLGPGPFSMLVRVLDEDVRSRTPKFAAPQS